MNLKYDNRVVLTLDAGGTNFVFSAVQALEEIIEPITLSAKGQDLETILKTIIEGFQMVNLTIKEKASAISFCFPGPADYKNGIIGDLENLPAFRGGVALKDMLESKFKIPVFINNDGDLFTLGESISGIIPEINGILKDNGISKEYKNLFGATFGTGYGGGIINNNQLMLGDNSAGGEINRMRNKLYPQSSVEESVSIRAIKRVFTEASNISIDDSPEPYDIFNIGIGKKDGDKIAATKAFEELAIVAGDSLANAITLTDSLVVIGGGLSGAHPLFLQKLVDEMNAQFNSLDNNGLSRMEITAFNLEEKEGLAQFLKDTSKIIKVPFTDKTTNYDPVKKIGVGISKLGTSKAVSVGAYAIALSKLGDK